MLEKILNKILGYINRYFDQFFTFHSRPKRAQKILITSPTYIDQDFEKIAIVIQGPLILESDFTLETIKLYRKNFPENILILSTWDDADPKTIGKIKDLGIEIILANKPDNAGISNVNYQIVSSSNGVNRARELNCSYILKSRSDQRIYSNQAVRFCYSAIKQFPLLGKSDQLERIIAFDLNTFKYRPYSISDMINFGNTNDMTKYWCIELDNRSKDSLVSTTSLMDWSKEKYAEVYFVSSFLRNIKREIKWTLSDSWEVMKDHFCILNSSDIDLFWFKYSQREFKQKSYESLQNQEFYFSDWLILQDGLPKNIPEFMANKIIG